MIYPKMISIYPNWLFSPKYDDKETMNPKGFNSIKTVYEVYENPSYVWYNMWNDKNINNLPYNELTSL